MIKATRKYRVKVRLYYTHRFLGFLFPHTHEGGVTTLDVEAATEAEARLITEMRLELFRRIVGEDYNVEVLAAWQV